MQKPSHPRGQRRVAVIGDSIAAGYGLPASYSWPSLLIARLRKAHPQFDWHLHNASVSGDTTPDAYVRFADVRRQQPHIILIALGINDCRRAYSPVVARRIAYFRRNEQTWWGKNPILRRIGHHLFDQDEKHHAAETASQVPIADFLAILGWMAQQSLAMHALPAFLTMSPFAPGLTDSPDFAECPRYNRVIRDIARETGAALIEISTPLPAQSWQADHVHLTPQGQEELARRIFINFHRPPIAPHLELDIPDSNAKMAPSVD